MQKIIIEGGQVLLADGRLETATVVLEDGKISSIGSDVPKQNGHQVINAAGKYVLPGIVDIHGDAFERQIMPRPGVQFDLNIALMDTDAQMLANGITTAFHGITYSWEPGLRGRDNFFSILDGLGKLNGGLRCDTRMHLRFETFNIDAADEVADLIGEDRIGLLAFNDHTPEIYEKRHHEGEMSKYADRTGLSENQFITLLEDVYSRADEVPDVVETLAASARLAGVPQLSHDDAQPDTRTYYNDLGCEICEFPETEDTAETARDLGNPIVMGAPNVVRGGSHNGSISASEMIAKGLCTVLASDYYYPAQINAAFRLHRQQRMPLAVAWSFVSRTPAEATGLTDRGLIAEGKRADIIVVDAETHPAPSVVATIAEGRLSHFR